MTRLMNDIKVVPTGAGNLFEISYRGDSPERAQRLVEATLELFTHAGPNAKKRDAEDADRFIEERISAYDAQLREAENRLKEFKVRHFGVSGQSNEDFFTRMSGLTEEVNKLRLQLNSALQSRDAYRRELALEEELPPELAPRTHGPALQDAISRLDGCTRHPVPGEVVLELLGRLVYVAIVRGLIRRAGSDRRQEGRRALIRPLCCIWRRWRAGRHGWYSAAGDLTRTSMRYSSGVGQPAA